MKGLKKLMILLLIIVAFLITSAADLKSRHEYKRQNGWNQGDNNAELILKKMKESGGVR